MSGDPVGQVRDEPVPEAVPDEPVLEPVLDEAVVGRLRGLGPGFLAEVLELYARDARTRLDLLRAAVRDGDVAAVAQAAHALSGASAAVGAHRVHAAATGLEEQARAGTLPDAGDLDALAALVGEVPVAVG